MKIKRALILYRYNHFNNDFEYVKEYYTTREIQKEFKLKNPKSIYNYIKKTIEDNKNLLFNEYLIIKEEL